MLNAAYTKSAKVLQAKGDRNFCGPLALAQVLDMDIEDVNNELIAEGKRVKGKGMSLFNILGFCHNNVHDVETIRPEPCTMATVARRYPTGRYIIEMRGHVAALIDGEVRDWTEGRRHKVVALHKVTPIGGEIVEPKPQPKPQPKPRAKTSKSQQMLAILQAEGSVALTAMAERLSTSVGSVRCYVNYFAKGSRGHDQIAMHVAGGIIHLGSK